MEKLNCVTKEPFMRLGEGGAPVLDYNIPQATCFNVYGRIPYRLSPKIFKKEQQQEIKRHRVDVKELREQLLRPNRVPALLRLRELVSGPPRLVERVLLGGIHRASQVTPPATANAKIARKMSSSPMHEAEVAVQPSRYDLPYHEAPPARPEDVPLPPLLERLLYILERGKRPHLVPKFGGGYDVKAIQTHETRTPMFLAIEEFEVCSYLGNYGAGKTVRTFSLLPGEKTTISVRTYSEKTETAARSENVLDSWSESSSEEFETSLQEESGDSSSSSDTDSQSMSTTVSGFYYVQMSGTAEISHSHTDTSESYAKNIQASVQKNASASNAAREVEVNVSTTSSATSGEDATTTRTLENINRSRVLNFVFRQLLQEYFTLVYLNDVKFMFWNGNPDETKIIELSQLEPFLQSVLLPESVPVVLAQMLKPYCKRLNYKGESMRFIEKATESLGDCPFATPDETYSWYRKAKDLQDEYRGIKVNGIILKAFDTVLRTSSLVVDSLLGQGEALDCYNQNLQEAAVNAAHLQNEKTKLGLDIIRANVDPALQALSYKQIFSPCCEDAETSVQPSA